MDIVPIIEAWLVGDGRKLAAHKGLSPANPIVNKCLDCHLNGYRCEAIFFLAR